MRLIILFFFSLQLNADIKQEMLAQYQNLEYDSVCSKGSQNFSKYRKDEEFISLYAFACLYSNHINKLSIPTIVLRDSKESRSNSAYFSIVLMQEKLLKHALMDGYDISGLSMPSTDYILSKVFDMYTKLPKHEKKEYYIFHDTKDKSVTYKLYLIENEKKISIAIDEISNNVILKKHIFL